MDVVFFGENACRASASKSLLLGGRGRGAARGRLVAPRSFRDIGSSSGPSVADPIGIVNLGPSRDLGERIGGRSGGRGHLGLGAQLLAA